VTNNGTNTARKGTLSFLGAVTDNGVADAASGLLSFKTAASRERDLEIGSTGTLSLWGMRRRARSSISSRQAVGWT
jgi:hypothetical protein